MTAPSKHTGIAPRVRATIRPASDWSAAASDWNALYAADPTASFFMSPAWVATWLEVFSAAFDEVCTIVFHDLATGEAVGAAVLTQRVQRLGGVPLRRLALHTAGEPDDDDAAVEHITLLTRPEHTAAVRGSLAEIIRSRSWDELLLAGGRADTLGVLGDVVSPRAIEVVWRPTYLVDLAMLRTEGAAYETVLSRNTRHQMRRSLRLYRERGEVNLRGAASLEDALALFDELGILHSARWAAQGIPGGAFASRAWRAFHERLIACTFAEGGTHLLRVAVGNEPIGLLYLFVARGVVSFYQSGFRYESDNRIKPGLVTHVLAIQHYLEQGLDTYDFLAAGVNGARYKESLSTSTDRLAWAVARRATARNATVTALRKLKRVLRRTRA
jgi:CelD/BcsL family acetyltransferase involved in cellulose biosynthesis